MTEAEAKAALERDGYSNIYTWFDSPETEYPPHTHHRQTAHIILEGVMIITMNGEPKAYGLDQRVEIPAGTIHHAKVGSDGCAYVTGEK